LNIEIKKRMNSDLTRPLS